MIYKTVLKNERIDDEVNALIKDGYKPVGGVSIVSVKDKLYMAQAMVKTAKKTVSRFVKPTRAELNEFGCDNKLTLDGFYDFYEGNGWKVGKNKMSDWKATARNWGRRNVEKIKQEPKSAGHKAFDFTEMDRAAKNKSSTEDVAKIVSNLKNGVRR